MMLKFFKYFFTTTTFFIFSFYGFSNNANFRANKTGEIIYNPSILSSGRPFQLLNTAIKGLAEISKINKSGGSCIIPTSYYESNKYTSDVAILTTVQDFFKNDCSSTTNPQIKLSCAMLGSFLCKNGSEDINVSTGFKMKFGSTDETAECRVYFPPHATVTPSSGTEISTHLNNCWFSTENSVDALSLRNSCQNSDLPKYNECIRLENDDDNTIDYNLKSVVSVIGKSKFNGGYDSADTTRNAITKWKDIGYVVADKSLCEGLTLTTPQNMLEIRKISTIEGLAEYCNEGVAVCAAFTGAAKGNKRCVTKSSSDLISDYMYHLNNDNHKLSSSMVASYFPNAPGGSGGGHFCFKDGIAIPFGMSVAMRRYFRNKENGEGFVRSAGRSTTGDAEISEEDFKRDNFMKGNRGDDPKSMKSNFLDFEIMATIF